MPRIELDMNPIQHITVDAIGQPGQRVFYIQGQRETDPQPVTIIIEKTQLVALMTGVDQLFTEISKQKPDYVVPAVQIEEQKMRILPPVDPLFRAGELGLGYDAEHDMMVILVREMLLEGSAPEDASEVRFWCTAAQVKRLTEWGRLVVEHGRPICPLCGQPMDPAGHFCPKKNGHKH